VRRQALIAAAALAAATGTAAARTGQTDGLRDARYCEFLVVKGTVPHATAWVWNTIKLGTCPQSWWDNIDAGDVAKAFGGSIAVLNGPRHFLMDAAKAVVGKVQSYKGQRLTNVAQIHLTDLDQSPFRDHVISRTNTWTWNKGRTLFELVAPGGDVYIMQSYSQIVDPTLTLAQLPSLGNRLKLPDGWRYRTRHLAKTLVLHAHGAATVLQDDLKDTYQLVTTTRPKGPRTQRTVHVDGATKNVSNADGVFEDKGTITGSPFGDGTIDLSGTFGDGKFAGTFRLLLAHGSVSGPFATTYTTSGNEIDFTGTGSFTGGTGLYRGITSGTLTVHDHNTLDGQNGVVTVDGQATY